MTTAKSKCEAELLLFESATLFLLQEFIWPIFFVFLLSLVKSLSTPEISTSVVRNYDIMEFKYGMGPASSSAEPVSAPLIIVSPDSGAVMSIMGEVVGSLQQHYNTTLKLIPFKNSVSMFYNVRVGPSCGAFEDSAGTICQ